MKPLHGGQVPVWQLPLPYTLMGSGAGSGVCELIQGIGTLFTYKYSQSNTARIPVTLLADVSWGKQRRKPLIKRLLMSPYIEYYGFVPIGRRRAFTCY